jgi:hypothetical protein
MSRHFEFQVNTKKKKNAGHLAKKKRNEKEGIKTLLLQWRVRIHEKQ